MPKAVRKPSADKVRTRKATLRANSFDPETGTFTAVVATATPVPRRDFFDGDFEEVLLVRSDTVRLGRFASGRAPLLDSHRAGSLRDQIGVITGARIEGGELVADVQLSDRDDVAAIASDIAAGIIRNVSVGYLVHKSTKTDGSSNRVITRTDWEPIELSLVTVPADANAQIRSHQETMTMARKPIAVARRAAVDQDDEHDDDLLTRNHEVDADDAADDDEASGVRLSNTARIRGYEAAAAFKVPGDVVTRAIAGGAKSLKEIRAAIQTHLAARSEAQPRQMGHIRTMEDATLDNPEFLGTAIGGVLYSRMSGKPAEGPAIELRGRSIIELGAALVEARGERLSWKNRDEAIARIFTRASGMHSTSDFPMLLQSSAERVLMDAYQAAACPLKLLSKERSASDFRPLYSVRLGEMPKLTKVLEGGEVTYGTRAEAKETFRVETFAKIFSLTRQAIYNDDLNAFADVATAYGRAAAETEASALVLLFSANSGNGATLDDGDPLYTTGRGNKAGSGTAIDETNLSAARKAMRLMKGLDGLTPISVTPKYLLVGPTKETQAEKVLATLAPATVSDVNPFSGKLELMVEPRLDGNAWRLFAAPGELATIRHAYLNGQSGPIVEQKDGWTTLGAEFRAVLDFGCGIEESRGTYLNTGA